MSRTLLFFWFTFATLCGPCVCLCAACPLAPTASAMEGCDHPGAVKCACCPTEDGSSSEPASPVRSCPCLERAAIDAVPAELATPTFDFVSTLYVGFRVSFNAPSREFTNTIARDRIVSTDIITLCHLLRC